MLRCYESMFLTLTTTLSKASPLRLFPLLHSLLTLLLQISQCLTFKFSCSLFSKCSVDFYDKLIFTIQRTQQCSTGAVFAQGHFNTLCSHLRVTASTNSSMKPLLFRFTY